MEAIGIFGDVFWHAVAPAEDDDCGGMVGGHGLAGLVAIAEIDSI